MIATIHLQVFYVPDEDPDSVFVITAYDPQDKAKKRPSVVDNGGSRNEKQKFPAGWDEKHVIELTAHDESQTQDEEFADIDAVLQADVCRSIAERPGAASGRPILNLMTTKIETHYQHLEPRPGSNYRQLFLKGRRIRAAVVDQAIHDPDPRTPEEFAEDYQVPLPAVLEALDYVAQNRALIEQERDREAARLRARGLDGPVQG